MTEEQIINSEEVLRTGPDGRQIIMKVFSEDCGKYLFSLKKKGYSYSQVAKKKNKEVV